MMDDGADVMRHRRYERMNKTVGSCLTSRFQERARRELMVLLLS
jgi:hypothetical protein